MNVARTLILLSLLPLISCSSDLTREKAGDLIKQSAAFSEPGIYSLQLGAMSPIEAGRLKRDHDLLRTANLLQVHYGSLAEGWRVAVRLTDAGREVWSIHLSDQRGAVEIPLGIRELIEVTGISLEGASREVEYSWRWEPTATGKALGLNVGPVRGVASVKLFDDGWRLDEDSLSKGLASHPVTKMLTAEPDFEGFMTEIGKLRNKAAACRKQKNFQCMLQYSRQAAEQFPDDPESWYQLGMDSVMLAYGAVTSERDSTSDFPSPEDLVTEGIAACEKAAKLTPMNRSISACMRIGLDVKARLMHQVLQQRRVEEIHEQMRGFAGEFDLPLAPWQTRSIRQGPPAIPPPPPQSPPSVRE